MIEVREAVSRREIKQFIKLPWKIYKDDPYWVPPLLFEQRDNFLKKKHPFFEPGFGEAVLFLVYRDGEPVGRVTAHINHLHNKHHNVKEGFFGFYECMDDVEASAMLLTAAEQWLRDRGMTRIIGPENYTIYDEIGFLSEGRENEPKRPVILEVYTPDYYLKHMEHSGFGKEIDWLAFIVDRDVKPPTRVLGKIKQRLIDDGFVFRTINMKQLDEEVAKIKTVVNSAWDANWGHVPYTDKQFEAIAEALKMIVDPRVLFMVEKEGKLVACSITLPDINDSIKKMNGRLFPFGWFHFLRAKKRATGLRTFLFGVLPEYRGLGMDAVMIMDTVEAGLSYGYGWSDCSIVVENNEKMIKPIKKWGGKDYRTFRIFSKDL